MSLVLYNNLTALVALVATVLVIIASVFHRAYRYWEKKGVAYIKPHFPLGSSNTTLPKGFTIGILAKKFYDELKQRGEKFGGVYLLVDPNLVVVDPDYIRDIMSKDFQYFVDRGIYHNEKRDPVSAHLFAIDGLKWKNLRVKLTPTFTSGKMKLMFQSVVECSENMKTALDATTADSDVEIKEILGCFTTDVIGACAFGINCNSFLYPDAEFRKMGKRIFEYDLVKSINAFFLMNCPNFSRKLGLISNKRDVAEFFVKIVKDTVKARQLNRIDRNDFLQILIDLKNKGMEGETKQLIFSDEEMAAQVFLFFIAGFETSATAMTFALYELARNQDIQAKLREEIERVLAKHDGKITYESLNEMNYLGQVVDETLRMYPPIPTINRRCSKEYTLRDTDITIERGTQILISTLGLHHDPEYYPNPERFDPERFNEENKKTRHPYVHLPFGEGPRNCIGLRFGAMQSRIGIITVIKNFKLTVSPNCQPLQLNPYVFLLNTMDPIYLRAERV